MSEDRRPSSAPASLPDDDDLLGEIFLRLPPLPSSLPRASLVCKRWRRLLCDPAFIRTFRARHHKPPMLGFFAPRSIDGPIFFPTLSPPDRIPPARFSLAQRLSNSWKFLGCRHGFVACLDLNRMEALVWKPVTGSQHHIPFPPEFHQNKCNYNGAVLSSAASDSHVRHSSAFKLVLAHIGSDYKAVSSLAVIKTPDDAHVTGYSHIHAVPHDNSLGLAILSKLSIQFWESEADLDDVNRWVLRQTVKLHNLLSPLMDIRATCQTVISGFDEDNNSIFLSVPSIGVIMIQLETMQCLKLLEGRYMDICYPYKSLYTAGLGIDGGDDKAEMLNST
ncbi:unnamed protein product [Urochloa decumbens]|uniref:F-box domain-containing protein n=1 Tax=Urochloa decumbens TaxID=240449 RepID=A0ABC8W077_9POAL